MQCDNIAERVINASSIDCKQDEGGLCAKTQKYVDVKPIYQREEEEQGQ